MRMDDQHSAQLVPISLIKHPDGTIEEHTVRHTQTQIVAPSFQGALGVALLTLVIAFVAVAFIAIWRGEKPLTVLGKIGFVLRSSMRKRSN